ncbi:MAG TPA: hypothetical protein VHM19_09100, partial [Polyangiales bacterium]|nr:hypothetical protein [Polyangiales bacterium]
MSRTKALVAFAVCVLACACAAKDNSRIGGPGNGGGGNGGDGAGGDNTALGGFGGSGQSTGGTGVSGNGGGGTGGSISTDGPVSIDDCGGMGNTSGLSAADLATLMAGGAATDMKYLYPYDGTIFPRGLIAPTLMWQGADDAEAVYVHIKSSLFELKGCYKPT